jgi:hypothetical protein
MTGNMITEAARLMPDIVVRDNPTFPGVRYSEPVSDTANKKVINLAEYKHILRPIPTETDTLDANIPGAEG